MSGIDLKNPVVMLYLSEYEELRRSAEKNTEVLDILNKSLEDEMIKRIQAEKDRDHYKYCFERLG